MAGDEHGAVHFVVECDLAITAPSRHDLDEMNFQAASTLTLTAVAPRRAGEAGVSADLRWVATSRLLLRNGPRPDAEVTSRLRLHSEVRLHPTPIRQGFCEIETLTAPSAIGFASCSYLAESPVALERIGVPLTPSGEVNPEFRPRQAFGIAPSWTYMGRYEMQQANLCAELSPCAERDVDHEAELLRMRKQLHGQVVGIRTPAEALRPWDQLQRVGPLAWAQTVRLPTVAPSWFTSAVELAEPGTSLSALATQFDAQQRWFVGTLIKPELAGARVERLTRLLWRVELFSDDVLRAQQAMPERVNLRWLPDTEFICSEGLPFGFQYGDVDVATAKRFDLLRAPGPGPLRLLWFYSLRPLPDRLPRVERSTVRFDREKTGFLKADLRRFDLDGDDVPDLLYIEVSGKPPDAPPDEEKVNDPWQRLLLVNLAGIWHLLGYDEITYHDGC
jgi:hypothetical protein